MSNNQMHGATWENFYKLSGDIPGAEKLVGQNHAIHDIPGSLDPNGWGIPSSVKSINSERGILCMADALRLVTALNDKGIRLVVGVYEQGEQAKIFHKVYKMLLLPSHIEWLLGSVQISDVEKVRSMINLKDIPVHFEDGDGFTKGRDAAEQAVLDLRNICGEGLVQFNPKVGRRWGKERRLQASVSLPKLWEKLKNEPGSACHTESIGNILLPLPLISTRRINAAAPPEPSVSAAA